jgi:hypothetical protein
MTPTDLPMIYTGFTPEMAAGPPFKSIWKPGSTCSKFLLDADSELRLLQRVGHLLFGELALPHDMILQPIEALHAGPYCYRTV